MGSVRKNGIRKKTVCNNTLTHIKERKNKPLVQITQVTQVTKVTIQETQVIIYFFNIIYRISLK